MTHPDPQRLLSAPAPAYADPSKVPIIQAQRKLTNTRKKQLVAAASRAIDDPPPPPTPSDCCGSSCDPCVKDLWKQEKLAWSQRWGPEAIHLASLDKSRPSDRASIETDRADRQQTMPGTFDW